MTDGLNQTAKFLIETQTRSAESDIAKMISLMGQLEQQHLKASKAAQTAGVALEKGYSDAKLVKMNTAMAQLGQSLKALNTAAASMKLMGEGEVTRILQAQAAYERLVKAQEVVRKNVDISQGKLGLDTTNVQEQVKAVKSLEAALKVMEAAAKSAASTPLSMSGLKNSDAIKAGAEASAAILRENLRLLREKMSLTAAANLAEKQADDEAAARKRELRAKAKREAAQNLADKLREAKQLADEENNLKVRLFNQQQTEAKALRDKQLQEQQRYQALVQNQQAKSFLEFNPNKALKESFGAINPMGAGTLQKIGQPGLATPEQITQQKVVLDLQSQLIELQKKGVATASERLALVQQTISAQVKLIELNKEASTQRNGEFAAQRELLKRLQEGNKTDAKDQRNQQLAALAEINAERLRYEKDLSRRMREGNAADAKHFKDQKAQEYKEALAMMSDYLKQKDALELAARNRVKSTEAEEYKQVLNQKKGDLLQHLEERERHLQAAAKKQKQIDQEQARQASEYLKGNATKLREAFLGQTAHGADKLQTIDYALGSKAQIIAQKELVRLQEQLIEKSRSVTRGDMEHQLLIMEVIRAKKQELEIAKELKSVAEAAAKASKQGSDIKVSDAGRLRAAFGDTNPMGAGTFQRVNQAGTATPEHIAAQRSVLALQAQIVAEMHKQAPSQERLKSLVEQTIIAKQKESALNTTHLHQLREQESAHRRMNLTHGAGLASLLAIQTAVRANGMILNGVQGAMGQALRSSILVEAEFKNVQAVTATTNTEMVGLEETIKRVASSTKFSAAEVAQAALVLGQAGLSAREAASAIPAVAMLATASGTSLAQAVSLTTTVLGTFDKQASEAVDIADKITQASNTSKVSVEKLALGFQYAGNIAHQTGISFEETTAAMSAMSNAGILSGATMGTGLRSFLTEVQKPSQEFISALGRIGLSLSDVDFKAHGLLGVTNKLREAGFVATDAIKSFDIRGAAAFNAMVANPADLERQYKNLLDTNAAMDANAIQMDSLAAQGKRLQTSMENLAGTGFAPVGQVLKDVANGMATFTQAASDTGVVVQALGAALAVVSVIGTTKFGISLVAGALSLAKFSDATVAATRALGTMTVAQAYAASSGKLTAMAAAVSAAFTGMTMASAKAAFSVTALKAALGSLGLISGVTLAVAGLAAGYYALNYVMDSNKRAMDEAKAASEASKSAYEEKTKTIGQLDESLKSLQYRQNLLKDQSPELRMAIEEVNSKFGEQIQYLDVNNTSAETLIKTLKDLRNEMVRLSGVDLTAAILQAKTLQDLTTTKAVESIKGLDKLKSGVRAEKASDIFDRIASKKGNDTILKDMGISEPEKLKQAAAAIRTGDLSGKNGEALSAMQSIVDIILNPKNLQKLGLNNREMYRLKSFKEDVTETKRDISTARQASNSYETLVAKETTNNAIAALMKQPYGKGTIGDALQTNTALADQTKQNNVGANKAHIFKITKADGAAKLAEYKALEDELINRRDANPNDKGLSDAVSEAIFKIAGLKSKVKEQIGLTLTNAKATLDNQDDEANDVYTSKLKVAKRQKGAARKKAITELNTAEYARQEEIATRGETDPEIIATKKRQAKRVFEAKLEADLLEGRGRGDTLRPQANKNRERTEKLNERAELASAAADKNVAHLLEDYEAVEELFQSGQDHIAKAGEHALNALLAKQADERIKSRENGDNMATVEKEFKEQQAAVRTKSREDLTNYIASFTAMGHASSKHISDLTHDIKATKAKLEDMKLDAEDAKFDRSEKLRELQLKKATPGSLGGYNPLKGSLDDQINQERLSINQGDINTNDAKLNLLGDENSGLIEKQTKLLTDSTNTVNLLEQSIRTLQAKLSGMKNDDPGRDAVIEQQVGEGAKLKEAKTTKDLASKGLLDSRAQKNAALELRQTLQVEQADIKAVIPVEFDYNSLSKTLSDGVRSWQDDVKNLSPIKSMADGMKNTVGTATSSMSTALANLATKTQNASQAFRTMATSIIKSMLDIAAQMASQQLMKGLFMLGASLMAPTLAAGSGTTAGDIGTVSQVPTADYSFAAATGGYVLPNGTIERIRHMAAGGVVTGGIRGKDSVPALLMPGEMVLNTKAVDSVGTDFLHSLNNQANSVVSQSSSVKPANASSGGGGVVNVYVVSPDQQPSMGPNDVVAVISDNITRGGSVKKLIRSVQIGAL